MSLKIFPTQAQTCDRCALPWDDHLSRARLLASVDLESEGVPPFPTDNDIAYHLTPYLCIELLRATT